MRLVARILFKIVIIIFIILTIFYLLVVGLPSKRIFPYSRNEVVKYLEQEFPGETIKVGQEPIRYKQSGSMQIAWMAELGSIPGFKFYVTSERYFDYDGWAGEFGHYYYRLTTSYESSFRNYLVETGNFQFLKGVSDYDRAGAKECVFMIFENLDQIDQMEEWTEEKELLIEYLGECGRPTDFHIWYGCRSVASGFTGKYVSLFSQYTESERRKADELKDILKERYKEYMIAFCATEQMNLDSIKDAVEKSRYRFYSFRGSDRERRSHDALLLVPIYVAGVGLLDKGSISVETMYHLLKEYEIDVNGETAHFQFQGINEKQYEFSETFIRLEKGERTYYYLEDGKEKLLRTDTTDYVTSELLLEIAGIGFKAVSNF